MVRAKPSTTDSYSWPQCMSFFDRDMLRSPVFMRFNFTSPVSSYFLFLMVPAFFQVILYIEKTSTSFQYCALRSWPKTVSFIRMIAMFYQTVFLLILNTSNDKSHYDWLEHSFFWLFKMLLYALSHCNIPPDYFRGVSSWQHFTHLVL